MSLEFSYWSTFHEENANMAFSGNCLTHSPINALPEEILAQIFRLLIAGEPCMPRQDVSRLPQSHYPPYPELLSYVCSRWRQISIRLPELWTHIDLSPHQLLGEKLTPRVEAYVSRSGQLPLYVHVHGSRGKSSHLLDTSPIPAFTFISARMRALDLSINEAQVNLCRRALGAFINSCLPGVFTRLVVRDTRFKPASPKFIMHKGEEAHYPADHIFPLAVSEEQLDHIFLPCTSLQLRGLFFPWTSKAYQGLVELRLSCPSGRVEISELQLTAILTSSPQLRNLEFGISVQRSAPDTPQVQVIVLPELENLVAIVDREESLARFVRLISPGLKPLDVSFRLQNSVDICVNSSFAGCIREFFSRSNVRLLSVSRIEYSAVINLLMLAPNVRALVLERCSWTWGSKYETQPPTQAGRLDVLYVVDSTISTDDLLELVEAYGVSKLVCWRYRQFQGGPDCTHHSLKEAFHERELSLWPAVELLSTSPILDTD